MEALLGDPLKVYKDIGNTRTWDLIHGGGSQTLEHHDAEGLCTHIRAITGCKIWGIVRPDGFEDVQTRAELNRLNRLFVREDWGAGPPKSWMLEWEKLGGKVFVIVARPGDLMYVSAFGLIENNLTNEYQSHAPRDLAPCLHARPNCGHRRTLLHPGVNAPYRSLPQV